MTKNDVAWQRYLESTNTALNGNYYEIDAQDLKHHGQREPRLMAKFDTPEQLPLPLKKANYTLLPIQNGRYALFPSDLFISADECQTIENFTPKYPFPLMTQGRGYSEAQYIDQAFNAGMLHQFLNITTMYQTIRGRERTAKFEFHFSDIDFEVEGVQIEVDAGYEAIHDIVLIEAKIGIPNSYNLRQIYYPYRHFKSLVTQKNIRNLFLFYSVQQRLFGFYEYAFDEDLSPASIYLKECVYYRIGQTKKALIHDYLDGDFKSDRRDLAPQANDLNKIFELIQLVAVEINQPDEITDYFGFESRQTSYYREAGEYLGLIVYEQGHYELTPVGHHLMSQSIENQQDILVKSVINSWIFVELISTHDSSKIIANAEIEHLIASVTKPDGSPRYSSSTIPRRRQTITAWLNWLETEIGCVKSVEGGHRLR